MLTQKMKVDKGLMKLQAAYSCIMENERKEHHVKWELLLRSHNLMCCN
jgi:DNA-binding transcriptional regulator PaaX